MDKSLIQLYLKDVNDSLLSGADNDAHEMLKDLNTLELKFMRRLKVAPGGKKTYMDFISMIVTEKENLIMARKYFREREDAFKGNIYTHIMQRNHTELMKFRVNYMMCAFVMSKMAKQDTKLVEIFNKISKLREEIINKHLHFAIHRAKTFNTGTNYNVDFGDLIQIANEALISSVDKYVIEETSPPFRTVVIGKMTAGLIHSGDQALCVTFGPQASRRLYQIKRLSEKMPDINIQKMSEVLNVAQEEISAIINASHVSSLDADLGDGDGDSPSQTLKDYLPAPNDAYNDPYGSVEKADLIQKVYTNFLNLTVLEQKILKLKGLNFSQYK